MQVLTGYSHDHSHVLNGEGAYEWWYVDALSENAEWGVVMIIFRGMPMSPDYLDDPSKLTAGYALSVYHRGVRVAFAFAGAPLIGAQFSSVSPDAFAGKASFSSLSDGKHRFVIDAPSAGLGKGASVEVILHSEGAIPTTEQFNADHGWVIAAPRCKADVVVRLSEGEAVKVETEFSGLAYHDHNMGIRAMSADFQDWYWGRVHTSERSIIYLAAGDQQSTFQWVGEADEAGRVVEWTDVKFSYQRPWLSYMGLRLHRRVVIEGTNPAGLRSKVVCNNVRACENGPFYQRYISQWMLNGSVVGTGTSEYMDVRRLQSPWIRPFLRLPWKIVHVGDR